MHTLPTALLTLWALGATATAGTLLIVRAALRPRRAQLRRYRPDPAGVRARFTRDWQWQQQALTRHFAFRPRTVLVMPAMIGQPIEVAA